ncbi:MAG: hypothetical protein JSV62_15910 [Promethearchaeota archaeon]|nr:MAG: hypothetical protein JSV62_15910 [Candidatus Lokiarchaeota archaeon]
MSAGHYRFKLEVGSKFEYYIRLIDTTRQVIDLTNFLFRMTIRESYGGDVILELTEANSRIIHSGDQTYITLKVVATDTTGITAISGVYDLEKVPIVDSSPVEDETVKVLYGEVDIGREATT